MNTFETNFDSTINFSTHDVFASGKENNKTYTFCDTLEEDVQDSFIEARQVKIDVHSAMEHWEIILHLDMLKFMTLMVIGLSNIAIS